MESSQLSTPDVQTVCEPESTCLGWTAAYLLHAIDADGRRAAAEAKDRQAASARASEKYLNEKRTAGTPKCVRIK